MTPAVPSDVGAHTSRSTTAINDFGGPTTIAYLPPGQFSGFRLRRVGQSLLGLVLTLRKLRGTVKRRTNTTQSTLLTMGLKFLGAKAAAALDKELMSSGAFSIDQLMELAGLSVSQAGAFLLVRERCQYVAN